MKWKLWYIRRRSEAIVNLTIFYNNNVYIDVDINATYANGLSINLEDFNEVSGNTEEIGEEESKAEDIQNETSENSVQNRWTVPWHVMAWIRNLLSNWQAYDESCRRGWQHYKYNTILSARDKGQYKPNKVVHQDYIV